MPEPHAPRQVARRDLPPPADLATVLKTVVGEAIRHAVYRYLLAIAAADGEVAPGEQTVLRAVAENLGFSGPGAGIDYST